MVLSNYIATQNCCRTSQIFFKSLFILIFLETCFLFLNFLEKQNATHSSSKPRLVERDSFSRENGGCGPYYTEQLAHTIDRT